MVFDNRKIITHLNMRRYITLIAYFISMAILLVDEMNIIRKPIFGQEKETFALAITIIYLFYVVYTYILNYNYFSFNDDVDKLVFRFVSLRPFNNKKTAIEINKNDFAGYKFKNSLLNLKQILIIKIRTRNGIASYPPISVTALSVEHKKKLKNTFDQLI